MSGLQLAIQLRQKDPQHTLDIHLFDNRSYTNDKTWCFWEKGHGQWDRICTQIWSKGRFITPRSNIQLEMKQYLYKMIESKSFYTYALEILDRETFHAVQIDTVVQSEQQRFILSSFQKEFTGFDFVFDSRIPPDFSINNTHCLKLKQQFKGWFIQTNKPMFDPTEFYLMDYRVRFKQTTSFTYFLPLSADTALVEFTLFANDSISDLDYQEHLHRYIRDILHIDSYKVLREEQGVIPMTTFAFSKLPYPIHHIPIGTAAGWVKPSTGYSFKYTERQTHHISNQLVNNTPIAPLYSNRHRYMDRLLLYRLIEENTTGEALFSQLFHTNSAADVFRFLDEESSLMSDLRLASRFAPLPFIKAILRS